MDEMKEWTIMFYFAGDNPLAPLVVPQLKSIKDAGFQQNTNVLVYFDPSERGVPTKIYDVNRNRKKARREKARQLARGQGKKISESDIGDGAEPVVRNLKEDEVTITGSSPAARALKRVLEGNIELEADEALESFITFCREKHPARHYILFLVGHGLIVGNDAFLPDDNPVSAITLLRLGEIMKGFADGVKKQEEKGAFELLALHSCSMSGIEVAYQLKGTANYMMATEGPTFAGDWHYRQMLKKSFNVADEENDVEPGAKKKGAGQVVTDPKVLDLIESLYFLTLDNANDYNQAGYSHDLTLCSLAPKKYEDLTVSIKNLAVKLREGLKQSRTDDRGRRIKELVLLAHLESQSYWGESYTDLFDFCLCLSDRCDPNGDLKDIHEACTGVIDKLKPIRNNDILERFNALVIHSDNVGWEFQYSHGFSVYFPWSKPIETRSDEKRYAGAKATKARKATKAAKDNEQQKGALQRYGEYAFTKEFKAGSKDESWLSFLEVYFTETERARPEGSRGLEDVFVEESGDFLFDLHSRTDKVFPLLIDGKVGGGQGPGCSCPSIKNYPKEKDDKKVNGKIKSNLPTFSITEGALEVFKKSLE